MNITTMDKKTSLGFEDPHDKIITRLKSMRLVYEILEHKSVYTMSDVAETLDIPEQSQVKTLIIEIQNDKEPQRVLCGVTATGRLDFKSTASHLGAPRSKIKMIPPDQIDETLGVLRGAIGLVLPEGDQKILLSDKFAGQKYLFFGVGRNDRTLKVGLVDLLKAFPITLAKIEQDQRRT